LSPSPSPPPFCGIPPAAGGGVAAGVVVLVVVGAAGGLADGWGDGAVVVVTVG
jgi:hypothetical protein